MHMHCINTNKMIKKKHTGGAIKYYISQTR